MADPRLIDECRRWVQEFYGRDLPATTYVPQPPLGGAPLAVEAHGVGPQGGDLAVERAGEHLVVVRHAGIGWYHCAHVVPGPPHAGVYDGAADAFRQARARLAGAGVRFEQVIRTWLYLGGIVEDDGPTQRYKELNRARDDFFREVPFAARGAGAGAHQLGPAYPASTGIGTEGRGFVLSALAVATERDDVVTRPLENPRQTPAFDYAAVYSPKSPKFSRAMALACGADATLLVSGTASIRQSETQHQGDAVAQTHETLANIEALLSEANLRRHGLAGRGTSLDGLGLARVYVKRPDDYPGVRAACAEWLDAVPTTFVKADVCRPDLLVEIEAVAFSRARQHPAHAAPYRIHVHPAPRGRATRRSTSSTAAAPAPRTRGQRGKVPERSTGGTRSRRS